MMGAIFDFFLRKKSGMLRSRDHFFGLGLGLGLTVIGLGLGLSLMKYWTRSHTFWFHGLKSIICNDF